MPPLILIPFAVFFGCCGAQFWLLAAVRNSLIDRHPETYLKIERSSLFPQSGLMKFIRSGAHNELGDAQLTRQVVRIRWLYAVAIGAWLVFAATMFLTVNGQTR